MLSSRHVGARERKESQPQAKSFRAMTNCDNNTTRYYGVLLLLAVLRHGMSQKHGDSFCPERRQAASPRISQTAPMTNGE